MFCRARSAGFWTRKGAMPTLTMPVQSALDDSVTWPSHEMMHEVSAVDLFQMGIDPERVGRALVEARGDARRALTILKSGKASPPKDKLKEHQYEVESQVQRPKEEKHYASPTGEQLSDEEQLELAIRMSLEGANAIATADTMHVDSSSKEEPASSRPASGTGDAVPRKEQASSRPAASTSSTNELWAPPRYLPAEGADALRVHGGHTLSLVENVEVRDGGYCWQRGTAFLDTGNQHMTIIDRRFAARHAIFQETPAAFAGLGQAERWTTLHGVVPGASSRAPVVTIALKLRGEEFVIQAAVSDMGSGHDLLLGVDVLGRMFASGYHIGSGSM